MGKFEVKLVSGFTMLGILASYSGNHSSLEKAVLVGGPIIIWLCLRSVIRSIRM